MPSSSRFETREDELCRNVFLITLYSEKGEKKCAEITLYYMVLDPPSQKQLIPFCFKAILSSPPPS